MQLTPVKQREALDLLSYAYAIAGKLGPRNAIDRRSTAHVALVEAVAEFDPAEGISLREHVRRKVRDGLRNAKLREVRRERFFVALSREEWRSLDVNGLPATFVGAESQEWVDHVLGQLDPADEALAYRVFVVGESIREIAREIDNSNAYRVALTRKVAALRDRIAEIIIREGGLTCN